MKAELALELLGETDVHTKESIPSLLRYAVERKDQMECFSLEMSQTYCNRPPLTLHSSDKGVQGQAEPSRIDTHSKHVSVNP